METAFIETLVIAIFIVHARFLLILGIEDLPIQFLNTERLEVSKLLDWLLISSFLAVIS